MGVKLATLHTVQIYYCFCQALSLYKVRWNELFSRLCQYHYVQHWARWM